MEKERLIEIKVLAKRYVDTTVGDAMRDLLMHNDKLVKDNTELLEEIERLNEIAYRQARANELA
jgi:hypothetical protein